VIASAKSTPLPKKASDMKAITSAGLST